MGNIDDYFSNSPVYRIWIDLIEQACEIFVPFLLQTGHSFSNISCEPEGIIANYFTKDHKIQFIFRLDKKFIFNKWHMGSKNLIDTNTYDLDTSVSKELRFDKQTLAVQIESWKSQLTRLGKI